MISLDRTASWFSGSQTGNGSAQTFKHNLGVKPAFYVVQVDDEATATATIGTLTSTDFVVTVTNLKTYRIMACAFAGNDAT